MLDIVCYSVNFIIYEEYSRFLLTTFLHSALTILLCLQRNISLVEDRNCDLISGGKYGQLVMVR